MATIFAYVFYAYLLIGLLFGLWFIAKGITRMDHATSSAGWGLRLLWLPGSIAMWPILIAKGTGKI